MNDDKLDSFAKTLQQKTDDGRREWWKIEDYGVNDFAVAVQQKDTEITGKLRPGSSLP